MAEHGENTDEEVETAAAIPPPPTPVEAAVEVEAGGVLPPTVTEGVEEEDLTVRTFGIDFENGESVSEESAAESDGAS